MKKLTKLGISPEKIMKNEDLINLKGGYDGSGCAHFSCSCTGGWRIWHWYYCDLHEMINDINFRCGSSGGDCIPVDWT